MAGGNIAWKETAIISLTTTGGSMSNGTAIAAGTDLDMRAAGNAADNFSAIFELICQITTVTGIVAGTVIAELYLVPKIDGTNPSQNDLTSGSGYISPAHLVGLFVASKVLTTNTDTYFHTDSRGIDLMPVLYTAYLIGRSGQTVSANWSLKVVPAQAQYT